MAGQGGSFRGLGAQAVPWWGCEYRQEKGASSPLEPGRCGLTDPNSILASAVMRILMSSFNQLVGIGISGRNVGIRQRLGSGTLGPDLW